MYRFFTLKLILSILFTSFFFLSSALSPLTIITKDSVFSRVFSLLPKLLLKVVFYCDKLREDKNQSLFVCRSEILPQRFMSSSFLCNFCSRKNYKNIQKNNLVICVFLLLFESRDHVWPRDAPKRIPRTKNRLSFLVVFAKKVCTQIWVRVSARLT